MIKKIKKVLELKEELDKKYGIYSVYNDNALVFDAETFLGIAKDNNLTIEVCGRDCDLNPFKATFELEEITFEHLMDNAEFEEFEKLRKKMGV